jgi:hypothetical protein
MRVLIQFRSSPPLQAAAKRATSAPAVTAAAEQKIAGLVIDPAFPAVQIPTPFALEAGGNPFSPAQPKTFSFKPEESSYLMRGTIPDADVNSTVAMAATHPAVMGIFADPVIESCLVCPGSPAVGSDKDVAKLLSVGKLAASGMNGTRVALAIVDTGINVPYLKSQGRKPVLDVKRSWTPAGVPTTPGNHPKDHGTMCAYDVGIAAPNATLLDYAVLLSKTPGATVMAGLLSDAVLAYSKLLTLITAMPAKTKALVVSNSWGMFDPKWDFPVGHPGNYSDNPAHPFNVIVASLEHAGADILFAAGNCGRDCPDSRCKFGKTRPICGANSHPAVLSIAGIDVTKTRVGYSSQGPGRLSNHKPDISAYTHFTGSKVYPEDSGTSAAFPVAAGVIAAIRTKIPSTTLTPAQLKSLIFKSADDLGKTGYDYDYGWGAIDPGALLPLLP